MKIFDINLRQQFYNKEIIQESLRRCNVLKINDEELVIIGRMFGYPGLDMENKCWLILGKYDLDMLVLTCGTNGSYVFKPGEMSFQATPKVEVADTVGSALPSWLESPFTRHTNSRLRSAPTSAPRTAPCPPCLTLSSSKPNCHKTSARIGR